MASAFAPPLLLEQDLLYLPDLALSFAPFEEEEREIPALFQEHSASFGWKNESLKVQPEERRDPSSPLVAPSPQRENDPSRKNLSSEDLASFFYTLSDSVDECKEATSEAQKPCVHSDNSRLYCDISSATSSAESTNSTPS